MWGTIASVGLSAVSSAIGFGGSQQAYAQQKAAYKYNKKLQEYKNKMTYISAGMQQNSITQNVTTAIQQSALKAKDIQVAASNVQGQMDVAAAATGTTGRSVALTKLNAARAAAGQEYSRQMELENTFDNADRMREQISMQAVLQQDLSWNQSPTAPSAGMAALNFGLDAAGKLVNSDLFSGGGSLFGGSSAAEAPTGKTYQRNFSSTFSQGFMGGLVK